MMAQAAASICDICTRGPGEHYCQECDQFFCVSCKISHLRTTISTNHTFLNATNINKEENILCTEHKESFLFYCNDCHTPVCKICSVKKHSRHFMTDLTELTEKLMSELVSNIESKVTTSKSNISKIESETKSYREEVKGVIKSITEKGNYWKKLIDKKVEALVKLAQDGEQREIQNMSAYSEVYKDVLENCQTWQKNIKKMETTAGVRLIQKLKQLQTDVNQIEFKQVPEAPSVSYRDKTPSGTEIDNLFEELQVRDSKAVIGQTDNQESARKCEGVHPQAVITFALIGSPGSGKSETANTILGVMRMETPCKGPRVTEKIQCGHVNKNGINLTVIDTPGFISTDDFVAIIREIDRMEIKNVIYGITLRVGRTTEKETAVLSKVFENQKILKYLRNRTCFVFTNKDEFLDFDYDSTMLEDNMVDQWLVKSPIIKRMIRSNNYTYCAITNGLRWENRNKESNKLMTKIMETYEACPENDNLKLGRIEDLSVDDRLDEVLSFTVREIRDLLTEVPHKEKQKVFLPFDQNRIADDATRGIFQTLRDKGSSLTEKEVKIIFGYDVPTCTIF